MYLLQNRIGFAGFSYMTGWDGGGLRGTYRSDGFAMTYALRCITIVVNPAKLQDSAKRDSFDQRYRISRRIIHYNRPDTYIYAYISGAREMEDNAQDNPPIPPCPLTTYPL